MNLLNSGSILVKKKALQSCTFPSICLLSDGKILATFRGAPSKGPGNEGENGCLCVSADHGATFSQPVIPIAPPVIDGKPTTIRTLYLTELPDNRLLAVFNAVDATKEALPYYNDATEGIKDTFICTCFSTDGGVGFSAPTVVHVSRYAGCPLPLTGAPLLTCDGRIGIQFEVNKSYDDEKPWIHHSAVIFSADMGKTFTDTVEITNDKNRCYWDQRLTALSNGTLLDLFWSFDRTKNEYVNIHSSISTDYGAHFTAPQDTGLVGQPGNAVLLPDGQIACVYIDRTGVPTIKVAVSSDGGRHFTDACTVYRHEQKTEHEAVATFNAAWTEMGKFTVGHPYLTLLDDNTLLVYYYVGTSTHRTSFAWSTLSLRPACAAKAPDDGIIRIGSRIEMFVDDYLIFRMIGTSLQLTAPEPKEIVLRMDQPWEGPGSGIYACTFHDGEKFRMYYRGCSYGEDNGHNDGCDQQYNCYAESEDGIHWEKKALGLISFNGSKENNILFEGRLAHNFSPMLDTKPGTPADARYKAVCGHVPEGLLAFKSPDGFHWEPLQKEPVITSGAFDSHNLCIYDENIGEYRCYSRYFAMPDQSEIKQEFGTGIVNIGIRAIQSNRSPDFLHWSEPIPNEYGNGVPLEQFYTNATVLCPGAAHHYLSFPMRFMSERFKTKGHPHAGVSDAVFMSSRDGVHFDRRFMEAWIRPDLSPRNWTQRNYITTWGILDTAPEEFSLYVGEHYEWDDAYVRRYTVRKYGFASVHAPYAGGFMMTKPFIFEGSRLHINYATSAPGFIRVGIVGDETGWPAPGYSTEDCDIVYGNELDHVVTWHGASDLSKFSGKPVRLKFEMKDADLYSIRFGN